MLQQKNKEITQDLSKTDGRSHSPSLGGGNEFRVQIDREVDKLEVQLSSMNKLIKNLELKVPQIAKDVMIENSDLIGGGLSPIRTKKKRKGKATFTSGKGQEEHATVGTKGEGGSDEDDDDYSDEEGDDHDISLTPSGSITPN